MRDIIYDFELEVKNLSKEEFVEKYSKSWKSLPKYAFRNNTLDKLHRKAYNCNRKLQELAYKNTLESWEQYFDYLNNRVWPSEWEYKKEYYTYLLKIKEGKINTDYKVLYTKNSLLEYIQAFSE